MTSFYQRPANHVSFYPRFNLRNLFYLIVSAGLLSVLAAAGLITAYRQLNQKINNCPSISAVGIHNQLWMLADQNLFYNPDYPEVAKAVTEAKFNSDNRFVAAGAIIESVSYQNASRYTVSSILYNLPNFIEYTVWKWTYLSDKYVGISEPK